MEIKLINKNAGLLTEYNSAQDKNNFLKRCSDEKFKEIIKLTKLNGLIYNEETDSFDCITDFKIDKRSCFVKHTFLRIKFGKINGSFNCSNCELSSLVNAPTEVNGYFDCSYNFLTSLEFAPDFVKDTFDCSHNRLFSLDSYKNKRCLNFCCDNNFIKKLSRFKYKVKNFYCSKNKLVTLENCPATDTITCDENKLTSLKGVLNNKNLIVFCPLNPITLDSLKLSKGFNNKKIISELIES